MVDVPNIFTRVRNLDTTADGAVVDVIVEGPRGTPEASRNIRARARALAAAGVAPSLSGALEDLTVGEIKALTTITRGPRVVDVGRLTKTTLHRVEVNRS